MATDKLIEEFLIGKNIFVPSVLDTKYGDTTELTKRQVIEKTLVEMSRYCSSDTEPYQLSRPTRPT